MAEALGDRDLAVRFNNRVWELLGKTDRTAEEAEEMVHAAHASLMHWRGAGTVVHRQRGLWLIARVYAELGNGPEALAYARRCADLTARARTELEDFDLAYSQEALARAHAVAGEPKLAQAHREEAVALARAIPEAKSRDLVLADIAAGNWGTLGGR